MTTLCLLLAAVLAAPPTHADVAYGDHERQRLDLYLVPDAAEPTPLLIYIHGGGFTHGDKGKLADHLVRAMHAEGISVAAINYRFVTTDPLPAAMLDGARAVQFLRAHAEKYNLDTQHFAATGGSAGAGISLWLAMHDDLADPESDDPIARQSTRLSCVVANQAQVSYDPRFWKEIGLERALQHRSFPQMYGHDVEDESVLALYEASSPIHFLTADDPPMRLDYAARDVIADDTPMSALIHHPRQGLTLREACEPLGVTCEVNYPGGGKPKETAVAFVVRHLKPDATER